MLVSLKPPGVRKESVEQVIARFRRKVVKIEDARAVFVPVQDVKSGAKHPPRATSTRCQDSIRRRSCGGRW